jgi:hypothetical protein
MYECYLCGCELEEKATTTSKNHKEHIIPQALGGHLTATGILCRECGGDKYLSRALDKPFSELFKSIAIRLDVRKDRGSKSKIKSISAKLKPFKSKEEIDVNITQNKEISYKKPSQKIDIKNKVIYVYGNRKTAKTYKNKVLKDIKDTLENYEQYEVKVISDLSEFQEFDGVLEFPFNLNNEVLIKSLNKIAIEFALLKGVEVSEVTHLVDREKRQIKNNKNTLPYFPIEPIEYELEYKRPIDDPNYISHSLALFIQKYQTKEKEVKQVLICFIELFGTFQFLVVLNSDYKGKDIGFKSYSQKLQKEEIVEYKPKPNQITPDEISIHLDTLNINRQPETSSQKPTTKLHKNMSVE